MKLTRHSLLLRWGLTVTGAYLLTEYFDDAPDYGHAAVLWTRAGAMLVPVVISLLLGRRANVLVWVWAGALVLATVENFGAHAAESKPLMHFSFHALWFLFDAVDFAYTAAVVDGSSRKRPYAGAALLNLIGADLLLVNLEMLGGLRICSAGPHSGRAHAAGRAAAAAARGAGGVGARLGWLFSGL
ncbi:hypothetical protein [Hymenobacter nivis]|uniref:Uncharacterized protein n=1 Tax=Hymenobacter nivis TaxID=1850093 RepID=A0A2Z3GJZ9_9BACT|nr:hypothetical protein [Hymenobacter nivis]AWM32017.1 hypothetical protein DDQ68_03925 [Hymenobacter nivis]